MFLAASYVARRRVDSLCVSACSSSSRHGPGVERMWASQGLGLPMKLLLSRASGALLHGTRSLREGDTMNDHRRGAAGSGGSNIQSDYHRLFQRRVSGSWNNSRRAGPAHGRSEAYRGSEDVSELYGSGRGGIMGVAGGVAPVPMRIDLKKPDWSRKDREQQPIAKKDFYVECSSVSSKSQAEIDEWRAAHSIEVLGTGSCPRPMLSFDDTPFADSVKALLKSKFGGPSPIQSQGWSLALTGRDMVGSAQTGSGKTLAFILPALHHIASQPRSESSSRESTDLRTNPRAVFLVPTRELANQINDELLMFTPLYGYRTACVFGGSNNRLNQIRQIYQKPELLVATPGRLIDFVSSGTISLEDASYVVLDEADRMLDMGFEPQVRAILSQIHPDSQISMWSATWPKRIQRLASTFLKDSIRIRVGSDDLSANKSVKQEWVFCTRGQSLNRLQDLLKEHRGKKTLIFCRTKNGADELADCLYLKGYRTMSLHGDKSQTMRMRIMNAFRSRKGEILIATDIAARGIDVSDIQLVVNYQMPTNIEDYIHRIGRTGRAGQTGLAIGFFTDEDVDLVPELLEILKESEQDIPKEFENISARSAKGANSLRSRQQPQYASHHPERSFY